MGEDKIDYEKWALELCSLLDEIEKHAGNEAMVRGLLSVRFQIAEEMGMKVKMLGPGEFGTA